MFIVPIVSNFKYKNMISLKKPLVIAINITVLCHPERSEGSYAPDPSLLLRMTQKLL